MISCMGGWCKNREKCQHYFANHKIIVERLCGEKEEPEPLKEQKNDDVSMRRFSKYRIPYQ